jgi:hypothetical protein
MTNHPVDLLLRGHEVTHSEAVAHSEPYSLPEAVRDGLDEEQVRNCPHGLNSIAWHFWHMACTEDEGVSLTAREVRLFDAEGWATRLRYPRRNAAGMTKDESLELSRTVDVGAVWAYRDAVGRRTREVIAERGRDYWLEPLTQDGLEAAVQHQVYSREGAESVAGFLVGLTKEGLLSWWAHQHSLIHLGQATTLRHLVQMRGV